MSDKKSPLIVKAGIALLFSAVFPVVLQLLLKSNFPLIFLLVLVLSKTLICIAAYATRGGAKKILGIISSIYSFVYAIILTIVILVTPASAYEQLFTLLQNHGIVSARVSTVFILFIGFFSSTFSGMILTQDFVWPFLGIALVSGSLAALLFMTWPIIIVTMAIVVACVAYLAFKYLDKKYRLRSIIFSVIIIALAGAGGYVLYNVIRPRGSKAVDALSNSLRVAVSNLFPRFPLIMEMPEYGFAFADEAARSIGETPVLSESLLLEVEATSGGFPVYLRTQVFDTYSQNQWQQTIKPKTGEELKEEGFLYKANIAELESTDLKITMLLEYYASIPHTLFTEKIVVDKVLPVLESGSFASGFTCTTKEPLLFGTSLVLKQSDKPVQLADAERPPYLQIPYTVTARMRELAARYKDIPDPAGRIAKIRSDLERDYTYNLETKTPEKGKDFLEDFLFNTKSGYSAHFATALVVLARLNDIPARYATGFFTILPEPDPSTYSSFKGYKNTISGYNAHVWAEVYYPDKGWQIAEATPILNMANYDAMLNQLVYKQNIVLNSITQSQVNLLLGRKITIPGTKPTREKVVLNFDYRYLLLIPILGLLFLSVYSQLYLLMYLFGKKRKTLFYLSRKIVKRQQKNGILVPETTGWIEWGESLKHIIPRNQELVTDYVASMLDIVYGGASADKQAVKHTFRFYQKVGRKRYKNATSSR